MTTLTTFRRSAGATSAEVLAQDVADWADLVTALVNGGLELPSIDVRGTRTAGNLFAEVVRQTFRTKDVDQFVPHSLGVATDAWVVVAPPAYAMFRKGDRPPAANGFYVQCDLAGGTEPVSGDFLVIARRRSE